MGHLPVVSEKKIKMLKTTFVATQIEVLQVVPQSVFVYCPLILPTCTKY